MALHLALSRRRYGGAGDRRGDPVDFHRVPLKTRPRRQRLMRKTRRSLMRAALAAPLVAPLLPHFAKAAEFSLRLAHTAPLTFPIHVRMTEAAAQIAKESN